MRHVSLQPQAVLGEAGEGVRAEEDVAGDDGGAEEDQRDGSQETQGDPGEALLEGCEVGLGGGGHRMGPKLMVYKGFRVGLGDR